MLEMYFHSLLHSNCKTEPTNRSTTVSVIGQGPHITIFVINFKICWKDFYVSLLSFTSFPINIHFIILFFFSKNEEIAICYSLLISL